MNILIISCHPDDETLGCGGTILRHVAQRDKVHWAIATEATEPQWSRKVIDDKAAEVEQVAAAYGMASVTKLGFPATGLERLPLNSIINRTRQAVERVQPEIVYLVHEGDVHSDHGVVFTATMAVCKAFYMRSLGIRRILSYETLSSTEAAAPHHCRAFVPNVTIETTPFMERKVEIMELYRSEIQSEPFPRSPSAMRALARYRGAAIGVDYAEAFVLIRDVQGL
jgi:LmbE family N-acetylglucosaminyl deacetylase